jgi:hypothetical protein
VRADDAVVGVFTTPTEPTEMSFTLPPAAGSTRLTLSSLDGADSPANHGNERDKRTLSVAVARVRLEGAPIAAG